MKNKRTLRYTKTIHNTKKMPNIEISEYMMIETDTDISVDEFIDSCDSSELNELREYFGAVGLSGPPINFRSMHHEDFLASMRKIEMKYNELTDSQLDVLKNIAGR